MTTPTRIQSGTWTRLATRAIGLAVQAGLALCPAWAQSGAQSIQLAPRESRTITIALGKDQASRVLLHLDGGIIAISSVAPSGTLRPLWPIDLGRAASVPYIIGGNEAGNYQFTVVSYERQRPARLTMTIGPPETASPAIFNLRDAEDDLAKAELTRRHWPAAPPNLNAAAAFQEAFNIARCLDNTPLERLALTQEARLMIFSKGEFDEARALLQQATALPPADDDAFQALAWKTLSTARYDLGDFHGAIQASDRAIELYRATGDRYWQGIVLGNLSSVYSELGQPRDAVATAKEALADAKLEDDPAGVVYCLGQLASLYSLQGDLQAAFRTYHEGLSWVSEISYAPLVEAEIQKDLGIFSIQVSDWDEAYRALTRAIEIEAHRDDPVSLESRGGLAEVLQHQGKFDPAIEEDSKAIAIAHTLKLKQDEAELLLKRAGIQLKRNCANCAEADIQAARALAAELNALPVQIEVEQAAGDASLAIDPRAAETHFREALGLAEQTGEREQQSTALAGIAKSNQAQGRLDDALAAIEKALQILEASRSTLSSLELRAAYLSQHRDWYELAVDVSMHLDRAHPGSGYVQRAFAYTERAHARSLLDALNQSAYDPAEQIPERLREAFARNRQQIENQQSDLINSSDDAKRASIAARLQGLYRDREGLEAQMQSADRRLDSVFSPAPIDISTLQRELLPGNSVLLSYWVGARASYRWTISAHSFSVETLPARSAFEAIVAPAERALVESRPAVQPGEDIAAYEIRRQRFNAAMQRDLERAGRLLLSQLPPGAATVFVVADGRLLSLPFPALRIASHEGAHYAIERYTFLREPSAAVALHLRHNKPHSNEESIAVFADPIFSTADPRLEISALAARGKPAANSLEALPRLTGSMREARQILSLAPRVPVELHAGFDANPDEVKALDPARVSILHFATHTVGVPHRPEVSGIALSMFDRSGQQRDGVLWARDIYSLHLPLALAMLSGCKTGSADDLSGEGLDSLAHAFFFSGVRAVGASLWNVDDDIASRLMGSFYRRLAAGTAVAESLRAAQLEILRAPTTNSPSLWAPFVLEGWPELQGWDRSTAARTSASLHTPRSR
ncbi:MAG TPA: CHAT domain-containing protein [Terracidiphilus sp.]|nr:CHAT domain-containing protein [Terracidiphilus sp.]